MSSSLPATPSCPRSSHRSTPSQNLSNGVKFVDGNQGPFRDSVVDSPARNLLEDLDLLLADDERTFHRLLEDQTATQQQLHIAALGRALTKHEEVRQSAERTRERVELEIERERRRLDDEEKKIVERARRELEEQKIAEEKRKLDEVKAKEEERMKIEALKTERESAIRKSEAAKRQQEEDRARLKAAQEKADADKKARDDADAREKAQQAQGQSVATSQPVREQANGVPPTARPAQSNAVLADMITSNDDREAVHNRYLDLHKRLKQMRRLVLQDCTRVNGLKNQVGDWRRAIKKCVGQISKGTAADTKEANRKTIMEIVSILDRACQVAEPSIDVAQFLVENKQPPGANTRGPAVLLFLLNHFAKNIISQFTQECGVDPKAADPLGVLAVTVFARPTYLFNGQSLIDLLWARFHRDCPVLFGIHGSEKTREGRARLGWRLSRDVDFEGQYIKPQEFYESQTGLGAGFGAITLRDFSKSKNANPAPNRIYWASLARIVNTPVEQLQPTHFIVLRSMIENYVPRIVTTFGLAGKAALRQALIHFPNEKGPRGERGAPLPAVTALLSMPMVLQRDLHFTL